MRTPNLPKVIFYSQSSSSSSRDAEIVIQTDVAAPKIEEPISQAALPVPVG